MSICWFILCISVFMTEIFLLAEEKVLATICFLASLFLAFGLGAQIQGDADREGIECESYTVDTLITTSVATENVDTTFVIIYNRKNVINGD